MMRDPVPLSASLREQLLARQRQRESEQSSRRPAPRLGPPPPVRAFVPASLVSEVPVSLVPPPPPEASPSAPTQDQDPMPNPKKKMGARHPQEVKDKVLARLKAGESGAAISRDTGIAEATVSQWKKRAQKTDRMANARAAKAARRTAKASEPKAPSHANGDAEPDAPAIVLTGLRAWVQAEVRKEWRRIMAQMGSQP